MTKRLLNTVNHGNNVCLYCAFLLFTANVQNPIADAPFMGSLMLFSFCNIHKEKTNIAWKSSGKSLSAGSLHDNVRKTHRQVFTIGFLNFKIKFALRCFEDFVAPLSV